MARGCSLGLVSASLPVANNDDRFSRADIAIETLNQKWVLAGKALMVITPVLWASLIGMQKWQINMMLDTTHRVGMNEYKIEVSSVDRYTKIQADLDNAQQTAFLLDQIRGANKETLSAIQKLADEIRIIDRRSHSIPSMDDLRTSDQ